MHRCFPWIFICLRVLDSPETGGVDSCELLCGSWELKLGPLEDQLLLSTAEQSLPFILALNFLDIELLILLPPSSMTNSQCSLGWLGIHYGHLAGPELMEICLSLCPQLLGLKICVLHHTQNPLNFFFKTRFLSLCSLGPWGGSTQSTELNVWSLKWMCIVDKDQGHKFMGTGEAFLRSGSEPAKPSSRGRMCRCWQCVQKLATTT